MPDCNFIIAGGSKTKIEEIKNKNYINNISFTGYIKPSKIQEFLSNCDILLAPYSNKVYSEYIQKNDISDWMSPLKIFEYMASKKPIIASNLPSLKEILEDKKTALLVDSKDTLAWKKSIEKILCKPEIAKKISENAFSLLKNNYTWKIRAKKVLDNLTFENISSSTNLNQASKAIILHIIGDLNLGGTERTMLKILPKLNNNHFEHQILTLFDLGCLAKDFQEAGIKVNCLNLSRSIIDFSNIKSIVKLIKRINIIKPSLIHTWLYHSNNLINILSPTLPQIPIINSIRHEDPKSGSLKTQISAIIGTILSNLKNNITIFCSESSKIKHLKMGYNPKKSLVIPNGFVIPDIDKEKSKTNLRQKLNISENSKIALIVGRYCKEKDYPTLLKAIKITIEKNPNIVFLLCGKGLENQNKELTNRIKQLRIENTIYLLGQQSNIEQIMASSDFLILSSNSESFPNVIAESMSVKTSCIATKVGETKNIIGDTGFIVESGNPQELANAILMFSNYDKQKLHILGEKAQSRIRNKYNLEKTINMYELIYSIFPS